MGIVMRRTDYDGSPTDPGPKRKRAKNAVKQEDDEEGQTEEEKSNRQQRLLKNREAAQQFRQRQKTYIQDLEHKIEELSQKNQRHNSKAELLEAENRLLKDQLEYLRGFISQLMSITQPMGSQQALPIMPPFGVNQTQTPQAQSQQFVPKPNNNSNSSVPLPTSDNPAASVAAAFQAAMGLSNQNSTN